MSASGPSAGAVQIGELTSKGFIAECRLIGLGGSEAFMKGLCLKDIGRAWRAQSMKYHTDKSGGNQDMFVKITFARDRLKMHFAHMASQMANAAAQAKAKAASQSHRGGGTVYAPSAAVRVDGHVPPNKPSRAMVTTYLR